MTGVDLHQLAEVNSGGLEKAWQETLERLNEEQRAKARRFFDQVAEHGRVTINLKQKDLLSFLNEGVYWNVHRLAKNRAKENNTSVEDELKKELNGFYDLRIAFDSCFEGSDDFKYGALNIGGNGAVKFGDHCLVLTPNIFDDPAATTVFIKSDSLATPDYWGPDNSIKLEVLKEHMADEDHTGHLAGLKHGEDAAALDPVKWPRHLAGIDRFIEAIFFGAEITIASLEAVRMGRNEYIKLFDDRFDLERAGLPVKPDSKIGFFNAILDLLESNGVPLELIDD